MREPAAVIFDMDGLMLDTERVGQAAYRRAAQEAGYPVSDELYLRTVGRDERATRSLFLDYYGQDFPYDAFNGRCRRIKRELHEREGVRCKPGLFELLDYLEARDIALAVATSTARARAQRLLTSVNLFQRFQVSVCGDEVLQGKPWPDIFLKAAAALDIAPSETLVLEDSDAGVRAAHAAGMRSIIVPDLKLPSPDIAALSERTCVSLLGVIEHLSRETAPAIPPRTPCKT
jgi:HAD superfamily hydrolase (TIGR01509 family)